MDPIQLEKLKTMDYRPSCHKNHPKTNDAFFVYILTALVFFSPFWYPSFESLIITLPNLISNLVTTNFLFIFANLIVFVLVGQSKLLTSKPSQLEIDKEYYHEYLSRSKIQSTKQLKPFTPDRTVFVYNGSKNLNEVTRSSSVSGRLRYLWKVKLVEESKNKEMYGTKGTVAMSQPAEELSKRADDFIARVNRQRRLEACSSC